MASSPHHPLMKYTLKAGLKSLEQTVNVMINNPAKTTGPNALKIGFIQFMAAGGIQTNGYVQAGKYVGESNRSMIVVGSKGKSKEFVSRDGVPAAVKITGYDQMNITHFLAVYQAQTKIDKRSRVSCSKFLAGPRV